MSFRDYLPSRNFRIVIGIAVLFSIVFLLFSLKKSSADNYEKDAIDLNIETVPLGKIVYKDSDGDGVLDWEEALWGTDPNNPDTNGDGIGDKEELDKKKPSGNLGDSGETLTETGSFARELFSSIFSLNQTGNLNESNLTSIADGLAKSIESSVYDEYNLDSLTVIPPNQTSIKSYFKETDKIFLTLKNTAIGQELTILPEYIEDSVSNQSKLEEIVSEYKKLALDLSNVVTPESISIAHLELVNTYNKIGQSIEGFLYINEDPMKTLAGLSNYEKYSNKIDDIFKAIDTHYIK